MSSLARSGAGVALHSSPSPKPTAPSSHRPCALHPRTLQSMAALSGFSHPAPVPWTCLLCRDNPGTPCHPPATLCKDHSLGECVSHRCVCAFTHPLNCCCRQQRGFEVGASTVTLAEPLCSFISPKLSRSPRLAHVAKTLDIARARVVLAIQVQFACFIAKERGPERGSDLPKVIQSWWLSWGQD